MGLRMFRQGIRKLAGEISLLHLLRGFESNRLKNRTGCGGTQSRGSNGTNGRIGSLAEVAADVA